MKIIARPTRSLPQRLLLLCLSASMLCLLTLMPVRTARADQVANAVALVNAGKLVEALAIADGVLAHTPNDAQMLFMKGMILTQQDQGAKAIAAFNRLTEAHPSLPEPYNNLAVLYAADGQYDKARAALEKAIRTNPSYATAFDNLGDVYAKLASQAYDKALKTKLPSADKTQLALVRGLHGTTGGAKMPDIVVAAAPKPAAAPAPAPKVEPKPEPKAEPKPEPKAEPKAEPKPASKPDSTSADQDEILKTLNGWATAWSSKDVKKYLSYYGNDFKTPKGMSRSAWSDERRKRIVGKGRIRVKVESPKVSVSGATATVKFHQSYSSDRLSVSSRKTMVFKKSGGKWKIQQELAN